MLRLRALALLAVPLGATLAVPAAVHAQPAAGLGQVTAHLRAVQTMTASFTQTDQRNRSLSGTLTIKRPGRIRFDYGRSANMLIVADGRALTFLDYEVGQQQRWPINDSPLSVLLNPNQDLARFARVVQDDRQLLLIEARDPRRREFGTITIRFLKSAGAPGGLILQGWSTRDAQNHQTNVRLSGQRFNVPVANGVFTYRPATRRGPRR
ncbi:MAG TPA: outer membrane lipoprotein carrier protein LolA [Allosphingosinicella sp.]|jgi:outer membrane lipoprotein-sorting protein|nr:outer membrane lipoprotein carrier protein LolA [Allosphingosinicella sp.]